MLFSYGSVVTGNLFYDRKEMQKSVEDFVEAKQAFMLKAPRRFGKTSLIKHVLEKKEIDYFYIDFRKTPRLELFNNHLLEYIYKQAGVKGTLLQIKENVMSFLRANKTTLKINLELFEASVELFQKEGPSDCERMADILDLAEQFAKDLDVTFYIVLDEFQDIKKLHTNSNEDILEMMRGAMQQHKNICYSFLGSNMTIMTEIFENSKSGFYNFCRKLKLESFDINEIIPEIKKAFKKIEVAFDKENDLKNVLIRLKGHPANTIMVMQNLEFQVKSDSIILIKQEHINKAYHNAVGEMNDLISEYIKEIKTKEHLHDVIYRMANNEEQILEPSPKQQKYKLLEKMGYITKVATGRYEIIDGFLEEDLRS